MFYLNENIMCVKYDRIVEQNEVRTKVHSLGTIKAKVDPQLGSVNVYFHVFDLNLIEQSTVLIWMKSNGQRITLTPTLELYNENHKLMRLKTLVMHSKGKQQIKQDIEEYHEFA